MDVIDLKSLLKEFYIGSRITNWNILTIKFSESFKVCLNFPYTFFRVTPLIKTSTHSWRHFNANLFFEQLSYILRSILKSLKFSVLICWTSVKWKIIPHEVWKKPSKCSLINYIMFCTKLNTQSVAIRTHRQYPEMNLADNNQHLFSL